MTLVPIVVLATLILHPGVFSSLAAISGKAFRHEVVIGHEPGDDAIKAETGQERLAIWRNSLEMIQDRPVTGVGLGNFKVIYPAYHQAAVKDRIFREEQQARNVHNDFLQITAELGLVGLLLFPALTALGLFQAIRLMSTCQSQQTRLLSIGLAGGMVAFLVQAMFSFPMQRAVPSLVLFTYLAIIAILYNRHVLKGEVRRIGIPRMVGIPLLIGLGVGGLWLMQSQFGSIMGDRYYRVAIDSEQRGAWSEVRTAALKSCEYNPHQPGVRAALGRAYLETGQIEKSIEALENVLTDNPYDINTMVNLGLAYEKTGHKARAIETLEKALQIKPDYPKVLSNLGKICMKDGENPNAIEYFTRALKFDKRNPLLYANLGYLRFKEARYKEAAREFERVLELDPNMVSAHKSLGLLYNKYLNEQEKAAYHMGKYLEARRPDDQASAGFRQVLAAEKKGAGR